MSHYCTDISYHSYIDSQLRDLLRNQVLQPININRDDYYKVYYEVKSQVWSEIPTQISDQVYLKLREDMWILI